MKRLGVILFGALVIAARALPVTPQEAAANMERALRSLKSLEARFEQIYVSASVAESLHESGEVYFRKPDLMRWEYRSPQKKVFLYTAGLFQMYIPEDNELTRSHISPEAYESDILGFFLGSKPLRDIYLIENAHFPSDSAGTRQIKLVPREEGDFTHILLEIDQRTWLIRRAIFIEWAGNKREFLFSRIRTNVSIPPKTFELKVPADCEIIDDDRTIKR
jgi:outer membrane lipoprotein carrier protein